DALENEAISDPVKLDDDEELALEALGPGGEQGPIEMKAKVMTLKIIMQMIYQKIRHRRD
ncbi:hypothetical protein HAX54_027098, partial [Datura stramonium]|nr:hypothetical protein [Datura stramonium]